MYAVVILQAVSGPVAGRCIEVPAGTMVRVGRTAKSDCAIGEDAYLSGQHFCIENDGIVCRVRDLGSSNGTFLNGERILEGEIKGGDSVAAGATTFTVQIQHASEAAAGQAVPEAHPRIPTLRFPASSGAGGQTESSAAKSGSWHGFSPGQNALLSTLYRDGVPVFAFLDPTRDSRIPAFLDASGEHYERVEETLTPSPYLVTVPPESRLLDVLVKDGWSRGWGFYFTSTAAFDELRLHWRSYVMLRNERGREITFRFWDPRVLRVILPAMAAEEAREFLGPVLRVVVEGDQSDLATEFSWSPRGMRYQAIVLI